MSLRFEKLFACNYLFSKSGTEDYLFLFEFTFFENVDASPFVFLNWKYLGEISRRLCFIILFKIEIINLEVGL